MAVRPEDEIFQIERSGDAIILRVSPAIESLRWDLIEHAAEVVVAPIRNEVLPQVLVDLSGVNYFGSVFLSLLLRCWKQVAQKGGTMVICGASDRARELLRVTSLDTLWAIYDTRREAMGALTSD